MYQGCNNITSIFTNTYNSSQIGNLIFVNNAVTDLSNVKNIYVGDNVLNAYSAFYWQWRNMKGEVTLDPNNNRCGNNVTNMYSFCGYATNITGNGYCFPNAIDMRYAYFNCYNLNGTVYVGNKIPNSSQALCAFWQCNNITGIDVNTPNAGEFYGYAFHTNISNTGANNGTNLSKVKDIVIGDATINMYNFLSGERWVDARTFTGNPGCGNNVVNFSRAYIDVFNMKGEPVIGPKVGNARYAYWCDYNLTGNPKMQNIC